MYSACELVNKLTSYKKTVMPSLYKFSLNIQACNHVWTSQFHHIKLIILSWPHVTNVFVNNVFINQNFYSRNKVWKPHDQEYGEPSWPFFLQEIIFSRWFLRFIPENMAMWFHLSYLWEGVQSLCYLYNSSLIVLVCQICLYKPCTTGIRTCACVIQAHKACMACTCKRRY